VTACFDETTAGHEAPAVVEPIDVGVRVEVELDALWS